VKQVNPLRLTSGQTVRVELVLVFFADIEAGIVRVRRKIGKRHFSRTPSADPDSEGGFASWVEEDAHLV
jgi:hypothetical protein